jgi:hypothetical protein
MRRLAVVTVLSTSFLAGNLVASWAQSAGGQRPVRTLTGEWKANATEVRDRFCYLSLEAEGWIVSLSRGSDRAWRVGLHNSASFSPSAVPGLVYLRVEGDIPIAPIRLTRAEGRLVQAVQAVQEQAQADVLWAAFQRSRSVLIFVAAAGEVRIRMPSAESSEALRRFATCLAWAAAAEVWSARDSLEFIWSFTQLAAVCQITARDRLTGAMVQATFMPGRVLFVLSHQSFVSPALNSRSALDLHIAPGFGSGFVIGLVFEDGVFRSTLPRSPTVEAGVLAMLQGAELSTGRRGLINVSAILPPSQTVLSRASGCIQQLEDPPADAAPPEPPSSRRT